MMPSRYTSDMSLNDAQLIADNFKVQYHITSIESTFKASLQELSPLFGGAAVDTTEENMQARIRGMMVMAMSNKTGLMVLTTGNKSEYAVGYSTLYGDMVGGYAPLKDVSKTLVFELCRWRNAVANTWSGANGEIIPQRIIDRPPSAELAPDQKDEDSLPPYDILDQILERYVERLQSVEDIVAAGFDEGDVRDTVWRVNINEYKRRQSAPGVKVTPYAFGRERRYPITSGFGK
jgi:NAD+ synthase (glutamine-hydrolysing)